MKNKKLWIAIGVLLIAVVGVISCGRKEADTKPVISEAVEEVESAEPEIVEPIEEEIPEETEVEPVETEFNGAVDINGNPIDIPDDGVESSSSGTDAPTDEEVEQEIKEQQKEQSSDNTNGGKGYDHKGVHYDTQEEYIEAINKDLDSLGSDDGFATQEEAEEILNSLK